MKYLFFLLPLVYFITSSEDVIVYPGTIDKVSVGMDSLGVVKSYSEDFIRTDYSYNGLYDTYESTIFVTLSNGNGITIDLESSKVFRITARGKRFITQEGVRWGDNISAVKDNYDDFEVIAGEEMGPPFVVLDSGIAFEFSGNSNWYNRDYSEKDLSKFIDSTMTIRSIIVFK